jgi:transcriptional regulator with XRE-family HTH domain
MRREHIMARLLRAVSGKTQEQFGKETGIHPSLVAQFELGKVVPSREHLERMAGAVALTVPAAEEVLCFMDTLRGPRERRGAGVEALLDGIAKEVRSELDAAYRRLLALPLNPPAPGGEG